MRDLLRRIQCFEEPLRETEKNPQALSPGKLQALSRLNDCAREVQSVAEKATGSASPSSLASLAKGVWQARESTEALEGLSKKIDRCVADLTLLELLEMSHTKTPTAGS